MRKIFARFIHSLKSLDRSIKVAIAATGAANFGSRMTTKYDPLYAKDLGADPVNIGVLTSIGSAVSSITAIPLGWAVENYSVKKVMLLNIALFMLHLILMGVAGTWWMLIPAYIISTRLLRVTPLADVIFVTAAKSQQRATVMSLSRVIWNTLNIFAPMTAAFIITYFGGINAQGIRPLYFLELFLAGFAFLIVYRYLPPTIGRIDKRDTLGPSRTSLIQGYREILSDKYVKRWVALRLIQSFGTNLISPFTALWLVEVKGATPYIIGIIGSTSLIVSLILQIPAGRLADKIGRKRVYYMFHPISHLGTFLAILAPNPESLIVVGLLGSLVTGGGGESGGLSGISFPAFITMFWECVPEEKRGRLFGLNGLLPLAAVPASILGGILWQQGYTLLVLLIPVLIDLIVVYPLLLTIPDIIKSKQ